MKVYHGYIVAYDGRCRVNVSDLSDPSTDTACGFPNQLDPRRDLYDHSPDEFGWGDEGPRSTQLALALCADVLLNDGRTLAVYKAFKRVLIETLPRDDNWSLSDVVVTAIIEHCEANPNL